MKQEIVQKIKGVKLQMLVVLFEQRKKRCNGQEEQRKFFQALGMITGFCYSRCTSSEDVDELAKLVMNEKITVSELAEMMEKSQHLGFVNLFNLTTQVKKFLREKV